MIRWSYSIFFLLTNSMKRLKPTMHSSVSQFSLTSLPYLLYSASVSLVFMVDVHFKTCHKCSLVFWICNFLKQPGTVILCIQARVNDALLDDYCQLQINHRALCRNINCQCFGKTTILVSRFCSWLVFSLLWDLLQYREHIQPESKQFF